jgi:DNA polymerase-3 subunit beta
MKVLCDRERLLHAFQTAASVAPSRSPKPILQNVKLEATGDGITLLATDLEIGIRVELAGFEVEASGAVVLPIGRFGSILRESTDEKLLIDSDGSRTRVSGRSSEFHLPTENPDEFPEIESFHEEKYHKVAARLFRELVRRTTYATENESSRYALGGVLLEFTPNQIIGVGTDGRRLARQQGPAEAVNGHESRENTIVPSRAMQLLDKAIADNEEEIWVSARENNVLVRSLRTTVFTRLVEGRFPKWRDVFPKTEQMAAIELTVGPMHAAVRQAAIVTSENHRGVDFTFGDGKLSMAAHGAEYGEARVELPITYDGAEIMVTLDPRFVADFLRVLDSERTFTWYVRAGGTPVVTSTDDGYSYAIMPLARD